MGWRCGGGDVVLNSIRMASKKRKPNAGITIVQGEEKKSDMKL
jgi:hypothetical protein